MRNSGLVVGSVVVTGSAMVVGGCFSSSSGSGGGTNITFDASTSSSGGTTSSSGGTTSSSGGTTSSSGGVVVDSGSDASPPVLSTQGVDFGPVNCGAAANTKTYTVQNTGPVPVTYSATVNSVFSVSGAASGTVNPGATATITLAATVPVAADPGTAITGSLSLTTNIPGYATVIIPLTVTPQGGLLVQSPSVVGFGSVQVTTTAGPKPVSIQNQGNTPVSLTLGAPSDAEYSITYTGTPASVTLNPGDKMPGLTASFTPSGAVGSTATVAIQTTSVLCAAPGAAAPDTTIELSGTGTTAPVSIGPSPLDFGSPNCGDAASQKSVTIKNGYASAITFTAALGLGASSPYQISAASGSVSANSQTSITVTPAAIPAAGNTKAGAYNDTLTITTSAPGSTPQVIPLQESASGAILAFTMTKTDFGQVSSPSSATLPFTLVNTGSVNAPVVITTGGAGFSAGLTGGTDIAAGAAADPGIATYLPSTNGPTTGTLSLTTSAPLCAPIPSINLTATGVVPVAVADFSGAPLSVSGICGHEGSSGTTTAALAIENTGNTPLIISGVTSALNDFTIDSQPGQIAPGQTGNIVVRGVNFGANDTGASPFNSPWADSLMFHTNEQGNPTYTIKVSSTVTGANIAWPVIAESGSTCVAGDSSTLTNSGNETVYVQRTDESGDTDDIQFGCGPGCQSRATLASNNGSITENVTFNSFGWCGGTTATEYFQYYTDPNSGTNADICFTGSGNLFVTTASGYISGCFGGSGACAC